MATYSIQAPNGQTYTIEGPDGAGQQDVEREVMRQHPEAAQPQAQAAPPKLASKPGMVESGLAGLAGGLGSGLAGAGAAIADYSGANNAASYLDEKRKDIQGWQQEHGGDTVAGKVGNIAGGLLPALAMPEAGIPALLANGTLFAIPGFRDTYNEQLQSGASPGIAAAHAIAAAGYAMVGGHLVGAAGKALPKALQAGEGAVSKLAHAAGEGAAFDTASQLTDKAIDAANGRQTDKPWVDPAQVGENAAAFGLLRGVRIPGENKAAAQAQEQKRIADEKTAAQAQIDRDNADAAQKQSPEYQDKLTSDYLAAEKAYQDAKKANVKPAADSPTFAADNIAYEESKKELAALRQQRDDLARPYANMMKARKQANAGPQKPKDAQGAPGEEAVNVVPPAPFTMQGARQGEMFPETGGKDEKAAQAAAGEQERAQYNKGPQATEKAPDGSPIFGRQDSGEPKAVENAPDGSPIYPPKNDVSEDKQARYEQLQRNLHALGGMPDEAGTGRIPGLLQHYSEQALNATDPADIARYSRLHNETQAHINNAYEELNKLHAEKGQGDTEPAPQAPTQSPLAEEHVGLLGKLDEAKKSGDMEQLQKAAEALQKNIAAGGQRDQENYVLQQALYAKAVEQQKTKKDNEAAFDYHNNRFARQDAEDRKAPTGETLPQDSGETYEGEHGRNERENAEFLAKQRPIPTNRTEQGRLFDNEQTSGSTVVSGAGGPSEKTIPELRAELEIARTTSRGKGSDKRIVSDAAERLRDAIEKEKAKATTETGTSPLDTGAKNLAEQLGTGKAPEKLKAEQAAREQRNVAYGKLVSLLDRFNKGKAKQDEVHEAVTNVLDGLVGEINAGRNTPMNLGEERLVRQKAYNEHLLDLINRFGDTRNKFDKGTKEKPLPIPAQRNDGTWDSTSNPAYEPGYRTIEAAAPGRRTFGNRHAAVMSIKEGLDDIRNKAVGQGSMEKRDTTITPATTSPESLARAVAEAKPTTPEQRTLLERIKDELPVLSTAQGGVADDVAKWLHGLRTGIELPEDRQAVIEHLARLEEGKRSETETANGKTQRAEQGDLFEDTSTHGETATHTTQTPERGTVFKTPGDFFKYLAGEGLRVARQMVGITTPSIHRAMKMIEPIQKRIDELNGQMEKLQAEYAAKSAEIKAKNQAALKTAQNNAAEGSRLVAEQQMYETRAEAAHQAAKQRAEAAYQAAIDNLAKERAKLDAELIPARVRLQNAHDAFTETVNIRDQLQNIIDTNASKFGKLMDEGKELMLGLQRRQNEMKILLGRDANHANYTAARKIQREIADIVDRLVAHKEQFPEAANKFLETDAKRQREMIEEIDNLHQAHTEYEAAEQALKALKRNQARRVGVPRAEARIAETGIAEAEIADAKEELARRQDETKAAGRIKAAADREVEAHALKLKGNVEEELAAEHESHSPETAKTLNKLGDEKAALEKERDEKLAPAQKQQAERTKPAEDTHSEREAASNKETAERNAFLERLSRIPTMRVIFDALQKARSSISDNRKAEVIAAMEQLEPSDASYKKYQTELNKIERAERYLADRDGDAKNVDRLKMEAEHQRLLQKTIPEAEAAIAKMRNGAAKTEKVKLLNENKRRADFLENLLSKNSAGVKTQLQTPEERRKAAEEYLTADHLLSLHDRGTAKGVEGTETAPLKKGRVSQASKKEVMAGDQRTNSEESKKGDNKLGGQNPVVEERKQQQRNTKVSGKEQREANTAAEEVKPNRPKNETLAAEARAKIADDKVADLISKVAAAKEKLDAYMKLPVDRMVADVRKKLETTHQSFSSALVAAREDARRAHAEADKAANKGAPEPEADAKKSEQQENRAGDEAASHFAPDRKHTEASDAVKRAVHGGDAQAAADELAKNGSTPEIRAAAAKLRGLLRDTKIGVDDNVQLDGEAVAGKYSPDNNAVTMHSKGLTEEDILHELTHAATDGVLLADPKTLTPDQRAARAGLEALHGSIKNSAHFEDEHGIDNVREFVAEVHSNADFRRKLDEIGKPLSLLERVKNFFRRMLGMPTSPSGKAQDYLDRILSTAKSTKGAEAASIFRGTQYSDRLRNAGALAERTIATERPLADRLKANATGRAALEFEIKAVDGHAGVNAHTRKMDSLAGTQVRYYLDMVNQRLNLLGQAVGRGFPELKKITRQDGRNEWLYETPNGRYGLQDVAKALEPANKITGGEAATNNLFSLYEVAKRSGTAGLEKLNYSGEITQGQLDAAMREIKSVPGLQDIFDRASDRYKAFNQDAIRFGISTGAFSKDLGAKMLANKDYVPYYRENDDGSVSMLMGSEEITKMGNVKDQPYLHELVGGDKRILDFATSSIRNANMIMEMGLRNQATKNTALELKNIGLADVASGDRKSGPNTLHFKIDGIPHYAVVKDTPEVPAELLVKGMAGLPVQQSALMKLAGMPSRLLRHAFVANPVSAARILFKDTLSSAMVSGSDLSSMGKALKNVGENLMERRGISGGETFTGLPADMANIYRQIQSGKPGWEQLLAKAYSLHAKADALTRQTRYESYRKQGLSEMEATYKALDSMNFTRRGISPTVHMLNTLNPFINSQIQAVNQLVKGIRGTASMEDKLNIRAKLFQRGMMVAGATLLYSMAQQDDPAYQNATPDQKYNNFFMRVPGVDEPLRIPIPFEAGMLFKSVPEAMVNFAYGHDKDAAAGMQQMAQRMIPGGDTYGIPQIMRPGIEAATDHNFYTGRSIQSRAEQGMSPEARVRDNTSGFAKALGEQFGMSPLLIDHLIGGYTGQMGLAVAQMSSHLVFGGDDNAPARTMSKEPFIGSLFQPEDAGAVVESAYQMAQEAQQVHNTVTAMAKKGQGEAAEAFLNKHADSFAKAQIATEFTGAMSKMQQTANAIKASTTLTPEEKRDQLKALQAQRTAIAKRVLESSDAYERGRPSAP